MIAGCEVCSAPAIGSSLASRGDQQTATKEDKVSVVLLALFEGTNLTWR